MTAMITAVGNLGGDPETRYTPNGRIYVRFNIASNRRWTDQTGQLQERTNWFRVTVWGNRAEGLVKLMDQGVLVKGRQVVVFGQFESREYQANDGSMKTSLEITASDVVLAGGGRSDSQDGSFGGNQYSGGQQRASGGTQQTSGVGSRQFDDLPDSGGDIDDIPF